MSTIHLRCQSENSQVEESDNVFDLLYFVLFKGTYTQTHTQQQARNFKEVLKKLFCVRL